MDTPTKVFSWWRKVVEALSSEWVLTKWHIPNGGAAVLLRALLSSLIVFFLVLVFLNLVDPARSWEFSFRTLRLQVIEKFPWFGVIFAGTYTAYYARFAAQWSYLANLYNSIKQTEAYEPNADVLADWKAGFIEDADSLHMVGKGTFVSIIKAWGAEKTVKECFITSAPGGKRRFEKIMKKVEESIDIVEHKFEDA